MQKLQVITLGCSKNDVDTEHILAQVRDSYEIVSSQETCAVDVQLLNTCGFIGDAKEQSINAILASVERKKRGEIGRLIVFGCLSHRYSSELPDLIPEVDEWFGAREFDPVVKALGVEPSRGRDTERYFADGLKATAYLKISEGCDRHCAYCAIPGIRGAHRSVPMETLLAEATRLAERGVKELVLIAQDSTFYGLDIYKKQMLAELCRRLSEVEGIEWIRIHYSYPDDFPEDVLDEMAVNPKICRYMDIPLQHIADPVLKMMRRKATGASIKNLITRLREKVPGIVIRTTMIVGHPGEGSREFAKLLDFVRDFRLERLGAFKYSEEEGTYGAIHYKDSVRESTKQKRYDLLMNMQAAAAQEFNRSRIGTEEKLIVDDFVDGSLICRSQFESPEVDGDIIIRPKEGIDGKQLVGTFIFGRITDADIYDLYGEML